MKPASLVVQETIARNALVRDTFISATKHKKEVVVQAAFIMLVKAGERNALNSTQKEIPETTGS